MILNMSGGGGTSLSFKVVPNPQPSNPAENTIWVNTDRITGYYFSATQPVNMQDREVWFLTGTSSPVEFNALKKNCLQVYLLMAKQYIDGKLANVDAMNFMNGEWVRFSSEWDGHVYDNGNQYEDHTGGWSAYPSNDRNYVVFNTENIQFVNGDNTKNAAAIYTNKAIDITSFKNLVVKGNVSNFDGYDIKIGITKSNTTGYNTNFEASTSVSNTGSMDAAVDLSGTPPGSYYIAVWSKYANFKITEIMLS